MILTVTLNPSMDYLYTINEFKIGEQNRFNTPIKMVGGKGINAGRTASIMGSEVISTGVLAGDNGEKVQNLISNEKFISHFFTIAGETRNAITIMHDNGIQTELVEAGPLISERTEQEIFSRIVTICEKNKEISTICLSGSANSKNHSLYAELIKNIDASIPRNINILTDISGIQLENSLLGNVKPFFIKPNIHEFSDLIGISVANKSDVIPYLNHELISDIPLVIFSCGEEGALAKYYNTFYDLSIPKIKLVNPTGSGDATVGGVAYSLDNNFTIEDTLKYAMACGVANAMESAVGFVNSDNVKKLVKEIQIRQLTL